MTDFHSRLVDFLEKKHLSTDIEQLTPDASTREYFRIEMPACSAIACVYPERFKAAEQSYLDVTKLFLTAKLPVAEILDFDESLGIILLEDFGDRILREEILDASPEKRGDLINQAIALIPKIQAATKIAFDLDSIASKLAFDVEKLTWELDFFKTHYFETLQDRRLEVATSAALDNEFLEISEELEQKAIVLCHRDFHAANLMLDGQNRLRIIDHQDARIGSAAYDLASLLLDRVTSPPTPEWLAEKRRYFLTERERIGLEKLDERAFADEFRLQTIQRCLKAAGTFSFQSATRGKTYFLPFITPMFEIVLRAAEKLKRFPVLQSILNAEIQKTKS
ncbi:MAG: aminoglycoside phosphotransferase family protein [Pyrinomonadaceae bacterium]